MRAELIEMNKFQASIREKNKHLRKLIKESQHEVKMLSCDLRDEEERELTRASSTKERARQPTMEQANEMLAKKLETKEMLANMLQAQSKLLFVICIGCCIVFVVPQHTSHLCLQKNALPKISNRDKKISTHPEPSC